MDLRRFVSGLSWVAIWPLAVASSAIHGAEVIYDVDLGGTAFSGHDLRVTGVSPPIRLTDLITTSDLTFHHEDDRTSLPALPTLFGSDEGHRESHCNDPTSPYWKSGYNLALAGKWSGQRI